MKTFDLLCAYSNICVGCARTVTFDRPLILTLGITSDRSLIYKLIQHNEIFLATFISKWGQPLVIGPVKTRPVKTRAENIAIFFCRITRKCELAMDNMISIQHRNITRIRTIIFADFRYKFAYVLHVYNTTHNSKLGKIDPPPSYENLERR